jgi:hypothetical protein
VMHLLARNILIALSTLVFFFFFKVNRLLNFSIILWKGLANFFAQCSALFIDSLSIEYGDTVKMFDFEGEIYIILHVVHKEQLRFERYRLLLALCVDVHDQVNHLPILTFRYLTNRASEY